MTDPSVGVSRLTLATHCKDAVTSARGTRTAAAPRSVTDRITGGHGELLHVYMVILILRLQV